MYRFHAKLSSRRNGQKACVKNIGQAETADDIGFAKRHFVEFLKIAERSATLQDSLTKQKRDAATGSVNHARNFTEKILTRPGRAPSCRFALVRRAWLLGRSSCFAQLYRRRLAGRLQADVAYRQRKRPNRSSIRRDPKEKRNRPDRLTAIQQAHYTRI